MLEDLLRRDAVAYRYSVAHFWRTPRGTEVDLLRERAGKQHATDIKAARASSPKQKLHAF